MATKENKHAADGCPTESVELDGKIISAAKSTFAEHSFERGYPEKQERLRMKNIGGKEK
jgi:hypothetical protein